MADEINSNVTPAAPVVAVPPTEAKKDKEDASKYTIFKSSYWYGKKQCMLFINHGFGGHNSFSIVIKQGNYSNIHNLTPDETVPVVRNMLRKLTDAQRKEILEGLEG